MIIREEGYDCDRLSRGDKLMIGNGSYGFRGTLDEQDKESCVALNAAGFYDKNGDNWRETVNMPNPLYVQAIVNGKELDGSLVTEHTERLNLENGQYSRTTSYSANDVKIEVSSRRFFLQSRYDLLLSEWTFKASKAVNLKVCSGIDCDVWNISGKHFDVTNVKYAPLTVNAVTNEGKRLSVELVEQASKDGRKNVVRDNKYLNVYTLTCDSFTLRKFCRLSHGNLEGFPYPTVLDFDKLAQQNDEWWADKWRGCRALIQDERNLQLAVDYSVYQLICYAPKVDGTSIGARGLSGQTYKGAVFWDTEIFMLPFYLETDLEVAKRLVRYRIDTLRGAMDKAKHYGYEGAFYAWESQEGGIDACSDFNVTDVFTNRPVRTYFKDKQIHISADVAIALYNTYVATDDLSLLTDGGAETLIQCALFYDSYAYLNPRFNRLELLDVIGPDEYHERVNNNAYTNYTARETAVCCLKALKTLQRKAPETYQQLVNEYRLEIKRIKRFARLIYLPQPNEYGVIEQFDGYFNLEDATVDTVRSRLVHPNEYWGGSNGVATATKVIKQADVIALFAVLPNLFNVDVMRANYDYYLPYTEHGSSLSASMYSLVACKIGKSDDSYEWFVKTASTDLVGGGKKYAGTVYIGGLHPAACGGTWLALRKGYLAKTDGSSLPKAITKLTLNTNKGPIVSKRN